MIFTKLLTKNNIFFSDVLMSLRGSPIWSSMVSTVEAEVMKLLENKNNVNATKKHLQHPENVELINKLIYEYMDWMGYKLTSTMFAKGKVFDFREQIFSIAFPYVLSCLKNVVLFST